MRHWVTERIGDLIATGTHHDAVLGYLFADPASQARRPLIEGRLHAIAQLQ